MRTAVVLLVLLAAASVPGSLLPQRSVAPERVAAYFRDEPGLAAWLDRLGLFSVYSAPWFAAVYLLLLTSLTGCVLPRTGRLIRVLCARPAPAPRHPSRLAGGWKTTAPQPAERVLLDAARHLRRRRFRVRADSDSVSAEKGYLHEVGNLAFHSSLLVLLVGVAIGQVYGYEGRVIVVEGAGFANTRAAYDDFVPGPWVDPADLEPFSFTLDKFTATFETAGPQRGTPRAFTAAVRFRPEPGAKAQARTLRVNHPLDADGTKVFLTGHGYAPRFTVRDGENNVVFAGPVVFLPQDGNLTSTGVIKAPDARPAQLGFEGLFLPTGAVGKAGPISVYPDSLNPHAVLTAYTGDLGLDRGRPQSVRTLDKRRLDQVTVDGAPLARALAVGEIMRLPAGQGSITFDGVARFANFQIARDPGKGIALTAALLLLLGLTLSLTVPRRRIFLRVHPGQDNHVTTVELAALSGSRHGAGTRDLRRLAGELALHDLAPITLAPPQEN